MISTRRCSVPRTAAVIGLMAAVLLPACAQPVENPGSPVDGLHACPGAGQVIGVFTGQSPARPRRDAPAATGLDTWALTVSGGVRQLTDDGLHVGAAISPDGRAVYLLRSSGRVLGDSLESPARIERLDVATGSVTPVAQLPGIVDLSVSDDGRRLAVAHAVESGAISGPDVTSVTLIDLASQEAAKTLPQAPDAGGGLFRAVSEVALAPDGNRVAYALATEVQRHHIVNSLRIRDLSTDRDTVVYTADGTDFVSDLDWSPDGVTLLASLRYQNPGDTLEAPSRFRTLRVDVVGGRTTLDDGFAQEITPLSEDGRRLLGLAPAPDAEGDARGRALISWDRGHVPSDRLTVDRGAAEISVASCSYK